ncbi:MAG TPA: hypothetical protein VN837_05420 [Chloroflexota bacterium]|nr:hypothetical protein [Chloroflexota bacterium]
MSLDDRRAAELGDPDDLVENLDALVMRAFQDGEECEVVATAFAIPASQVQDICGRSRYGHQWESYDQGDAATPYFQSWSCCSVCGAPDDRGYDDE